MQALKLKFKNLFNPSKRKKYKKSIVVSNPCDRKIWDHCTSIQDKISKSTPVKDRAGNTWGKKPDLQIGSSVIACDQNKQRKVFSENVGIWAGEASNIWEGK